MSTKVPPPTTWTRKDLIAIRDLSPEELTLVPPELTPRTR